MTRMGGTAYAPALSRRELERSQEGASASPLQEGKLGQIAGLRQVPEHSNVGDTQHVAGAPQAALPSREQASKASTSYEQASRFAPQEALGYKVAARCGMVLPVGGRQTLSHLLLSLDTPAPSTNCVPPMLQGALDASK